MVLSFYPKNKDIEKLFDKLIHYPLVNVDPKTAQTLSRHKKIRYLSSRKNIFIRKGLVGIPPQVKIKKKNGKFFFEFD
jgi:hypothetical protein